MSYRIKILAFLYVVLNIFYFIPWSFESTLYKKFQEAHLWCDVITDVDVLFVYIEVRIADVEYVRGGGGRREKRVLHFVAELLIREFFYSHQLSPICAFPVYCLTVLIYASAQTIIYILSVSPPVSSIAFNMFIFFLYTFYLISFGQLPSSGSDIYMYVFHSIVPLKARRGRRIPSLKMIADVKLLCVSLICLYSFNEKPSTPSIVKNFNSRM